MLQNSTFINELDELLQRSRKNGFTIEEIIEHIVKKHHSMNCLILNKSMLNQLSALIISHPDSNLTNVIQACINCSSFETKYRALDYIEQQNQTMEIT